MRNPTLALLLALAVAGAANTAVADEAAVAGPAAMPAWEQLTPAQRELLLAPLRDRWNANPAERARMYGHAQRWQQMDPAQRRSARRGMHRWEHMDPEHRRTMRALFWQMRKLDDHQRSALRERWHAMTPEQRRAWVQAHPPGD
jgi:hypothetical protein